MICVCACIACRLSQYKATDSFRFRLRSYHGECTGSRPLSEVKLRWAGVVLWWETTRERPVLQALLFFFLFFYFVLCCLFNFFLFLYSSNRSLCICLSFSYTVVYMHNMRCIQDLSAVKLNKPVNNYSVRSEQVTIDPVSYTHLRAHET